MRESISVEDLVGEDIYTVRKKVLPDSSGDEHVGFFRRFDRLQYGLQKIRGRPSTLSGNFYGSSVSSA